MSNKKQELLKTVPSTRVNHQVFWVGTVLLIVLVFCVLFSFCVVFPMLPASQDCPFLIVPSCFLGPLKVLMAQMHRAAQLVPWWRMGAKLSCYNTEGMAVDHRG